MTQATSQPKATEAEAEAKAKAEAKAEREPAQVPASPQAGPQPAPQQHQPPAGDHNRGSPLGRRGRLRRFAAFVWRGAEIRDLRAALATVSVREQRLHQYARAATEAADRLMDPIDPLRAGSGVAVAAALYAEAIRACRFAVTTADDGLDPDALLDELAASRTVEDWKRIRELALTGSPSAEFDARHEVTPSDARALREIAHALLERTAIRERRLRRLLLQRFVGVLALILVILGFALGVTLLIVQLTQLRDLAAGKPWRASSSYAGFSPANHECDGRKTAIFFHTNEEKEPWVEIDLQRPTTIERVRLTNRSDCCRERAIPLVVEVSADASTWTEIARRDEPFDRWGVKIAPITTRYVRVRALKKTHLHLEKVSVQ